MKMATSLEVKERPMLFRGPMVREILADRKTQTRRLLKATPAPWLKEFGYSAFTPHGFVSGRGSHPDHGPCEVHFKSPYGVRGGKLWVREAWAQGVKSVIYKADFDVSDGFGSCVVDLATGEMVPLRWRPSIHMPRSASRITLEITEVGIERLKDVSEADAVAEGFESRAAFLDSWRKHNGGESLVRNPFVWVVTFKRLEAE
jgi:hypothetical protein